MFTRLGLSVWGSRVLEVRGRTSGEWRHTPVNLLRFEDADYLVAPRGHTQWVKNLRVSGQGRLRLGRWTQAFTAVELADEDKPPLLRAYLTKWKWEVGQFFGGVGPDASEDDLRRIASDHPVFRISVAEASRLGDGYVVTARARSGPNRPRAGPSSRPRRRSHDMAIGSRRRWGGGQVAFGPTSLPA